MNDYCVFLDTNIQPLIDGIDITKQKVKQTLLPLDSINPELTDWLRSLGIIITLAEVFHWPKGFPGGIHTDGQEGDHTKLNWVYYGAESTTSWYSKDDPNYLGYQPDYKTPVGTPALVYHPDTLKLIHSEHIEGICILQTGVPHQVRNGNVEGRWTLSFVLRYPDNSNVPMSDIQRIFAPYIKT